MPEKEESWSQLAAQLRRAGSAKGRRALGASVAEGWRLLERALAAGVLPMAVLASQRAVDNGKPNEARVLAKLREAGVPCVVAPNEVVNALTGGRTFGDLLGLVPTVDHGLSPLLREAAAAMSGATGPSLLVGVQVLDPGNIGALTRTAHALGSVAAVWVGGTDPSHPKALRTSMGSCFRLPWTHSRAEPTAEMAALRAAGWRNVATVVRGGRTLPHQLSGPTAVWMWGEAHGLAAGVVSGCDDAVHITTAPDIDSLSVNAAAAVVLSRVSATGAVGPIMPTR